MKLKKDKKITAILLVTIMVAIPFGKSIDAYQGSISSKYISKSMESTLGDSENLKQDLESKPELLESYELDIEDIERLER